MARAPISTQTLSVEGIEPTQVALIADGHSFANDGIRTRFRINNGPTALVLTFKTTITIDGIVLDDKTHTIGANETWEFGPFSRKTYNQPDGQIHVDYDDVTDGTVEILSLPS